MLCSQIYYILDWGRKTNSEKISYHEFLYSTEIPVLVVKSIAMNIGVHVSFSIMVSSEFIFSSGIVGSYEVLFLVFLRNLHTVSIVALSICIPNSAREFPFLHIRSSIYCLDFLMMTILMV